MAFASIRVNFDSGSNVNDESESQLEKELSPRNSTEAGRQIDFNDEQPRRAFASIRLSSDLNSNAINSTMNPFRDEHNCSPLSTLIKRGTTSLPTIAIAKIETDKNETGNTFPTQ
jgi:hypothetical protein